MFNNNNKKCLHSCMYQYLLLLFVLLLFVLHESTADCAFPLNPPKKNQPLFVRKVNDSKYKIIHPVGDRIELKTNEEIYLACAGIRNSFAVSQGCQPTAVLRARCLYGTTVEVFETKEISHKRAKKMLDDDMIEYNINELKCKSSISGDTEFTTKQCANGKGFWVNVGFRLKSNDYNLAWIPLYKSCFSDKRASVIYVKHSLEITTGNEKYKRSAAFRTPSVLKNLRPSMLYNTKTQHKTFAKNFGSEKASMFTNFRSRNYYLAKGHLAPVKDFHRAALKRATFFYINAVPQWQIINNGNWKKIEQQIRLINSRKSISVYTGVHDILTQKDLNNNDAYMYLHPKEDKIEVPKWMWKIVLAESADKSLDSCAHVEGIAFVTLNDPFVTSMEEIDVLCENVCEEAGYADNAFNDLMRGYTYCCKVEALKNVVRTIPQKVRTSALMKNKLTAKDSVVYNIED